ncbi:hypothetical protein G7076_07255 [Sphingomonas sp. HDW15A]|uniref:winged helix-turn-helix domain-containing protein n=1 Tax=Sphingomonas sp. HDW15A TaxID=2714942 RepID=UPI00140E0BF4|nr:winged helix-turn-helix domain-containing protein [Sphingomonas sp. HDW15A]QIK96270.1 hypothetical protein G7076_07255 [Sphingomonas sp. HDW15A]
MELQRFLVAGPVWLDRRDERLWVNGSAVRLGAKALAILRTLMERPQSLVTKDELFDSVWPSLAVSEAVLTTAIKELRQALGDNARTPTFIETVHGRGYRFLLPVQEEENFPSAVPAARHPVRPSRRDWLIAIAAATIVLLTVAVIVLSRSGEQPQSVEAALAAHPKSIAVLPFEDLSERRDQQWFAAGLTEEILNSLARTPDLHVAARTSTRSIGPGDVREIGRRLNVAHVLEGSVRRDRGRVRVTAQLIRTSDGFHLWSQNYDRPVTGVVSIQEDIAIAIARALDTVMSPSRLQAMVNLGTRSVEAYDEYLKGLAYEQQGLVTGASENARRSYEAFERARSIDPAFAAAQWKAAQDWFGNATRIGSTVTEKRGSEAQRLKEYLLRVDAAIAASRGRPEQFRYRSARALMDLRFRDALRLMLTYLKERPRDLEAWDEAVNLAGYNDNRKLMAQIARRIHQLSMESGSPKSRAITAAVLSTDYPLAVELARAQLRRSPDEVMIQYQSHRALLAGGYPDEARPLLARLLSSELPVENKVLAELRQECADGGTRGSQIAARLDGEDASTSSHWQAAELLGEKSRATAILIPLHRPDRLTTLMQYLVYPNFDVRPFPILQSRLAAEGIKRRAPVAIPASCGTGKARRAN